MRYEGVRPLAERDRRHHDDDGQHATDRGQSAPARPTGRGPVSSEKRRPGDCRRGKTRARRRVHDARAAFGRFGPFAGGATVALRWQAPRSKRTRPKDQHGEAGAEHRPVEGDARGRIDLPGRPIGARGESATRYSDREQRPDDNGAERTERRSPSQRQRVATERSQDLEVLTVGPDAPADGQASDEERDKRGDGAEHPQRDRLGLLARSTCPSVTEVTWKV